MSQGRSPTGDGLPDAARRSVEGLVPESPSAAGTDERELEITEVEGARLLANDSRALLRRSGFSDDEIRGWAEAYYAVHHEGEPAELVAWIAEREHLGTHTNRR